MTRNENGPADGCSRGEAEAIKSDPKILQQLLDTKAQQWIKAAEDEPYAVAVSDEPELEFGTTDDGHRFPKLRRYRNRPTVGRLQFQEPVFDELLELSNVNVRVSGVIYSLTDLKRPIRVFGCRDADARTTKEIFITPAEFVAMGWLRQHFGQAAWYRADLVGHCLEGWIVTSSHRSLTQLRGIR